MARIIFTVTNDLSYDQRMQRIAASLVEDGHKVTLIGFKKKNSIPLKNESFDQRRLWVPFRKGKLFYFFYNIQLFWVLLFSRARIYGAIDLDTLVPNWMVARMKRKKLVYDAHELFTELPEVVGRGYVGPVWRWIEKKFIRKADLSYTVTQTIADHFKKKYNADFQVIKNMPLQTKAIASSDEEPYLIYQGFLNKGRGIEAMIKGMRELDIKLKIAGDGDISTELKELASQEGVTEKVEFLGFVPPMQLKTITASAALGINLLENRGLSYYYSLGNKFFDYVQAGIPQVCMDFPEYKALNKDFEVAELISECNEFQFVQAVKYLLADRARYAQLRENIAKAREEWTWKAEEVKLKRLYQEIA